MAKENERWGYTRIKGVLMNLGYMVGRNTIKRILQQNGIDPAPGRGKRMSWATFIKAHLGVLVGMDFFTVETIFKKRDFAIPSSAALSPSTSLILLPFTTLVDRAQRDRNPALTWFYAREQRVSQSLRNPR